MNSGCTRAGLKARAGAPPEAPSAPSVRLLEEDEYPLFKDDLPAESLRACAEKSIQYLENQDPKRYFYLGDSGYTAVHLAESIRRLVYLFENSKNEEHLNLSIKEEFFVYKSFGSDGKGTVRFSAYYEPTIEARLLRPEPAPDRRSGTLRAPEARGKTPAPGPKPETSAPGAPKVLFRTPAALLRDRDEEYKYPLYRKPPELVWANLGDFKQEWKQERIVGRLKNGRIVPFFSREEIDYGKVLEGKGLELAWVRNRFDLVNLHIQGSGRLRFPDGKEMRAKFAATNALPFKSPGRTLIELGVFTLENITHSKVREYLSNHPEVESVALRRNPRYTFFELESIFPGSEAKGTMGAPLIPGRSIAVDRDIFPLGSLAYYETKIPLAAENGDLLGYSEVSRFGFCQDTGGAIKGPGRVDIFAGHGPQAETTATNLWDTGYLYILVKKLPPRTR